MSNLTDPVAVIVRVSSETAAAIDELVTLEADESGHYVSRAVVCRKLIERGLRETQRKRKAK
jgi:hypothetical protein